MTTRDEAELYEHRNDDGEWSDDVEKIEVRPRRTEVISFRVPSDELDRLEDAAKRAGISLSEFVREAIQRRLEGSSLEADEIPVLEFMTGGGTFLLKLQRYRAGSMGEAPSSWVPDRPPVLVNVIPGDS